MVETTITAPKLFIVVFFLDQVTISLKLSKDSKSLKKRATTISMMWQKHFVEVILFLECDGCNCRFDL